MVNYALIEGFLSGAALDISADRFMEILNASQIITQVWDVEESFSLLAHSFVELEEYLLKLGLEYFFQRDLQRQSDHFFDTARETVNLKLVGALTASRMYEEQLHRRVSTLSKLLGEAMDLHPSFSKAYDNSLEYRVMYALRNHSLHNQLPIKHLTFGSSHLYSSGNAGDDSPSRYRITIMPRIVVSDFCSSDKIKKPLKDEVEGLGFKYLDLKFFARGFLACLAVCHEDFRKATEDHMEAALKILQSAEEQLKEAKGENPRYINICVQDDGRLVEKHYVDFSNKSRIRDIRRIWSGLKWTQRGYVSSEIVRSKDTYPDEQGDLWIPK